MALHLPGDSPSGCHWALRRLGSTPCADHELTLAHAVDLPAEAYRLRSNGPHVTIEASSEAGWHYGALELAEALRHDRLGDGQVIEHRAQLDFRAFKFNLPWNPYRPGHVMTQHQEVCREPAFWLRLLDHLAECRFNVLSLWSLLPFPWMVRVPSFPEATPFDDEEFAQWESLWRLVFREARARHIRPIVIWWTIFVPPHLEKAWGVDYPAGSYYIGPAANDDRIEQYNRDATTALIDAYDDLAGVGACMGERMQDMSPAEQRAWLERTVLAGVRAAKRPVLFVQRASLKADAASVRQMVERAQLPGEVVLEYKFNWSHGHSTPKLCMTHNAADGIDDGLWNPPPTAYRMAWMVRNEDFFTLRWGQSDFIRAHLAENTHPWVAGYFVGSEGRIPALELAEKLPAAERGWDFAFERQWLFTLMWGRLLFNRETPDNVFAEAFEERYGPGIGSPMVEAFQLASRMPLMLASFFASTWDYTLYAEGFLAPYPAMTRPGDRLLISVDQLIDRPTLDPKLMSISEFLATESPDPARVTPVALADQLKRDARQLNALLTTLRGDTAGRPPAYQCELDDLEAWQHLTHYFAAKLRGATALARYRDGGSSDLKADAVKHLKQAVAFWQALVEVTTRRYRRFPYISASERNEPLGFHWSDYLADVEADLQTAQSAIPPSASRTP